MQQTNRNKYTLAVGSRGPWDELGNKKSYIIITNINIYLFKLIMKIVILATYIYNYIIIIYSRIIVSSIESGKEVHAIFTRPNNRFVHFFFH